MATRGKAVVGGVNAHTFVYIYIRKKKEKEILTITVFRPFFGFRFFEVGALPSARRTLSSVPFFNWGNAMVKTSCLLADFSEISDSESQPPNRTTFNRFSV